MMHLLLPVQNMEHGAMRWRSCGAHMDIHQLDYLPSQAQMSSRSRAKVDVQGTLQR
jgi:hypothetical protein